MTWTKALLLTLPIVLSSCSLIFTEAGEVGADGGTIAPEPDGGTIAGADGGTIAPEPDGAVGPPEGDAGLDLSSFADLTIILDESTDPIVFVYEGSSTSAEPEQCGASCTLNLALGTYTIQAMAGSGYKFERWDGPNCDLISSQQTFSFSNARTCSAHFVVK